MLHNVKTSCEFILLKRVSRGAPFFDMVTNTYQFNVYVFFRLSSLHILYHVAGIQNERRKIAISLPHRFTIFTHPFRVTWWAVITWRATYFEKVSVKIRKTRSPLKATLGKFIYIFKWCTIAYKVLDASVITMRSSCVIRNRP